MCGIAGSFRTGREDDVAVVAAQVATLAHRGPDSWGVFDGRHGAIGQTRLAVIDLVTGDPPISTPDGSIGATLNGELYNYRSIREELAEAGHELRTAGDTEVLAHLAETLEPLDLARRLDGMFAFAVLDAGRRRLVLGRDRFGKKPLFWWTDGSAVVFGSEIKALLASPLVTPSLDPEAIPAYLTFGYVPTPRTFFAGVQSLPPGSVLIAGDDGIVVQRYWELPTAPSPVLDVSLDEAAGLVREGLSRAVGKRLIADVPVGAFLSGGIDSSAVVALMAQQSNRVSTFTIGFEDTDGYDERSHAQLVAERLGTDHHEHVVQPDAAALVEELVWHHDQPFGDSSALPTYLLSKVTRKEVTVALCGDGGDELFAGYERFSAALVAARLSGVPGLPRLTPGLGALAATAGARGRKVQRFLRRAGAGMPDALRGWISYVPDELVEELVGGLSPWATEDYLEQWRATAGLPTLDRILQLNAMTYLLDDLLPKVDRMSMANALEVRAPFLDHELAELAFRLPTGVKMRGLDRKRCLKRAMRGILPDEIIDRPKRGFGVPLDRWFRDDLAPMLASTLGSPTASVRRHVDGDVLDRILAEHRAGAGHGQVLWTLLTLELFLARWGW